jgi:hypothetical protein
MSFDISKDAIICILKNGEPQLYFPNGEQLLFTTEVTLNFTVNNLPKATAEFILHCPDSKSDDEPEVVLPPVETVESVDQVLAEMALGGLITPLQMRKLTIALRPIIEENENLKNGKERS